MLAERGPRRFRVQGIRHRIDRSIGYVDHALRADVAATDRITIISGCLRFRPTARRYARIRPAETLNEKHASISSQRRSWWAYTSGDDWRPEIDSTLDPSSILVRSGSQARPSIHDGWKRRINKPHGSAGECCSFRVTGGAHITRDTLSKPGRSALAAAIVCSEPSTTTRPCAATCARASAKLRMSAVVVERISSRMR